MKPIITELKLTRRWVPCADDFLRVQYGWMSSQALVVLSEPPVEGSSVVHERFLTDEEQAELEGFLDRVQARLRKQIHDQTRFAN